MIKKLPKSQIEFEEKIPFQEWEKYLDAAAAEISQEIKIAGFRPGKAPRNLVEQKVGRETLLNAAAQKAVEKNYAAFILKEKIEVLGSPQVELLQLETGKELLYKARVSVMPEIKVESGYVKEIKKINAEYREKKSAPDEKEIQLELERLAASRVKLVTVRRPAQKNDNVEIDFEVLMAGVPIEGGTSKKHSLIVGRGVFIPGFEENIIGMIEGQEKEFELSFPESYHKKELAGKPATFKVKMNLVQERQVPEINDEFAKSLGKFENLAELKKSLSEGLTRENADKLKEQKRAAFLDKIIENMKVDLPDILLDKESERMLSEFEYQTQAMGMSLDQYLAKLKKNRAELKKDWEPQARKRVLSSLALLQIAADQEIVVSAKETEVEANKTLQYYKNVKDAQKNIDLEQLYNYSRGVIKNEKVFKYLEEL